VAEKQAGELLAEARAQAQALLAEAEEEAERLSEQGREEFESALRELRLREEEEAEQAGVILADARAKAEQIVREAEERAENLVAQGEAEFESILGQISEFEARERELYDRLRQLESNGAAPEASFESAPCLAAGVEASSSESNDEEPAAGEVPREAESEAAARASRPAVTDDKPPRPAAGANPAIPDLVLLLDSDDDSPGALRRLFGSLRRLGHQDREELPEG
jgi:cell division septum initiation protein DivIVA